MCWLGFVNLIQLESPGKGEPQLRNYLRHIGLWECLWSTLLISNRCRRAHISADSDMPRWMGLSYVNKAAEKIWESS